MPYRFLEHTADVRIECVGATLAELFESAAQALYAVAYTRVEGEQECAYPIELSADTPEELMVRWLQELIYLMDVEHFAATQFDFDCANATALGGRMTGRICPVEDRAEEIKAATYHGMRVEHCDGEWRAEVILDL
jgi:protein archease